MKALAALVIACSVMSSAAADEVAAYGLHIGSHHFPAYQYNNVNPGGYVRMSSGMTYGAYYNSERKFSVYAGYTMDWGPFSLTAGLITGYQGKAVVPMLVPTVRLGKIQNTTVRVAFMPKASKDLPAHAVHLMLEW